MTDTNQLPPLPIAVAHISVGDDTEDVFTSDQMRAYALQSRAQLAQGEPTHQSGDTTEMVQPDQVQPVDVSDEDAIFDDWLKASCLTYCPDADIIEPDKFTHLCKDDIIQLIRVASALRPAAQEVDERAAFEAHQSRQGWAESDLSDRCAEGSPCGGEYRNQHLQDDWELWQARASLPTPQQATPEPVPATRAEAEANDWRDRLTVNLLRQGAGLTKTQIRALIEHAVDGTEPDPALFPAPPEPVGEPYGWLLPTEAEIDSFIEDYEMRGDADDGRDACYTPTESERFLIKDAIMGLLSDTRPAAAPAVPGLRWFTVAEHGMPDFDEEVIGGLWYTDPWLVPEKATRFLWGLCRVFKDDHRDFKDGKRWLTFGPSHNDITHWARLNMPEHAAALAAAQAKGADHG